MTRKPCAVPECVRPYHASGYCKLHYNRWKRHGDPHANFTKGTNRAQLDRFIQEALCANTDECILWPYALFTRGYGVYEGTTNGVSTQRAHVYVCAAAHGPKPDPSLFACHSCGKPPCVNPRHLRWDTAKANSADRNKHGTVPRGEANNKAKLTVDQVKEIRRRAADSESSLALSKEFGVSSPTTDAVIKRKTWTHVD